jgi:hypothetical protein
VDVPVPSADALASSIRLVEAAVLADAGPGDLWASDAARRLGITSEEILRLAHQGRIGFVIVDDIVHFRAADLARFAAAPGKTQSPPEPSAAAAALGLEDLSRWLTGNPYPSGGRLAWLAWREQVLVDLASCRSGLLGLLVWGNDEERFQAGAALRHFGLDTSRTDEDGRWAVRRDLPDA